MGIFRIRIFTHKVEIVVHELEIAFALFGLHAQLRILVGRHRYVVEYVLAVDVFGVVLQDILQSHTRGKIVLHTIVELRPLVRLAVKAIVQVLDHRFAVRKMLIVRLFAKVLRHCVQCGVGRGLIQFVAQSRTVEAVDAQETRVGSERTAWIDFEEALEIGLGSVVVLLTVVAQAPVVAHGVVLFRALGVH